MKKVFILCCTTVIMIFSLSSVHASDYQGEENRGSLFQVVGDLVTGNYIVDGKPIKDKGWFQISADETKKLKLSSEEDVTDVTKPAKPSK